MSATGTVLELDLAPEVGSVALARERIRTALEPLPDLSQTGHEDLELLVSELVSNVLKHGRPEPFSVRVQREPSAVRLSVTNRGRVFDPVAERPPDGGGFGFMMIRGLCRRWGVEPSGDGVTVWIEYEVR